MTKKSRKRVPLHVERREKKEHKLYLLVVILFIVLLLSGSIWLVEQIRKPRQPVVSSIVMPGVMLRKM